MKPLPILRVFLVFAAVLVPIVQAQDAKPAESKSTSSESESSQTAEKAASPKNTPLLWQRLFDGKSLTGWKPTNFGGEGDVHASDSSLILEFGSSMTGVTFTGDFPRTNYEIRLEAMRVEGNDFFCGLTFPVADSYCSWIVGGWGGGVVGLSSIDGRDASENDTTQFMKFDEGRWYLCRLRVTPQRIQAWLDEKLIIDQDIQGRKISTRSEVVLSQPLGFATWETKAALRNIEYRRIAQP
jgi:hypothetical protein